MNYKKIIKEGFINPIARKNLKDYYERQYKIADMEHYSINEFFDGCIDVIDALAEHHNHNFKFEKSRLTRFVETDKHDPNNQFSPSLESIENRRNKLKNLNIDTWEISIGLNLNGDENPKVRRDIGYDDIIKMKEIILEVKSNLDNSMNKKTSKIEPLDFNLNQTDIVHFFDLLVDADIIKEPSNEVHKNTKGGFYGKLSNYFTAKGKSINANSAKSIKTNKSNRLTSYSDSYFEMLNNLKKTIEDKLSK